MTDATAQEVPLTEQLRLRLDAVEKQGEIERLCADVERLVAALHEAIGLRVKLYRQSDCDGETDALTDRQVGECDDFVKQWLAAIDAARSKEQK